MKRTINILCVAIFVVLIAKVIFATNSIFTGMSVGLNSDIYDNEEVAGQPFDFYGVDVYPTTFSDSTAATLTDYKTKQQYQVWPSSMLVKGHHEYSPSFLLTCGVMGLIHMVATVIGLLAFIKFVRNVNRNDIFSSATIGHLRHLGWCFVASSVASTLIHIATEMEFQNSFRLSGYAINHGDIVSFEGLLFAIFTFIIAEAFAIAKKMKEEQELTI